MGLRGGGGGCQPIDLGGAAAAAAEAEAARLKAQVEATPKVREWVEQMLPEDERRADLPGGKAPEGKETDVMVIQLACQEDDCPDVETAITLLRKAPKPKMTFKVYKPAAEMSRDDVEVALLKAVGKEQGPDTVGGGNHGEHDDCCAGEGHPPP
eukprot:CAMPEP_0182929856 /NCGR_PEP_ID=MMETSP0105_2-20130417/22963_1 /TAXON_ID=81532 ORGANISM="Acanthoeca-like sp., Strain 10tr" /NCGR_SAMPLE_ID=MMETSP0105_2 /ASSEMBLY_ACC=CAM_ASM_000205 /LENGTH=153 /DNA_ID=CAMNT_0025068053 /DNA_START=24 /DNA_END=485 /DNA_ORIENTATION=+